MICYKGTLHDSKVRIDFDNHLRLRCNMGDDGYSKLCIEDCKTGMGGDPGKCIRIRHGIKQHKLIHIAASANGYFLLNVRDRLHYVTKPCDVGHMTV